MPDRDLVGIALIAVALIPSIVLHEVAHGAVANAFGDRTARDAGRLTLNPIKHIDPFGTILLPGVLLLLNALGVGGGFVFGWAKPVPIDAAKLGMQPWKMVTVAASGPLVNGALALASVLVLGALIPTSFRVADFLLTCVIVNVALFVFNLIPLPPLDGSKVVAWSLPRRARIAFLRLEQLGFALVFVLIVALPRGLAFVIDPLVEGLLRMVLPR
jgi:Zn-dependent protease